MIIAAQTILLFIIVHSAATRNCAILSSPLISLHRGSSGLGRARTCSGSKNALTRATAASHIFLTDSGAFAVLVYWRKSRRSAPAEPSGSWRRDHKHVVPVITGLRQRSLSAYHVRESLTPMAAVHAPPHAPREVLAAYLHHYIESIIAWPIFASISHHAAVQWERRRVFVSRFARSGVRATHSSRA